MKDLLTILQTYWPSIILLGLAAPLYAYCALHDEGKLKGWRPLTGFFGKEQYERKYAKNENGYAFKAPKTWYYRFFKLKYKEAYPLSATFLAFTTDGYHLFQLLWKSCIIASISILTPWPWTFFAVGFSLFTFVFAMFYKILSR